MPEERRLVTVLFADVVGSTALGEQLDAEDMRTMLGRYYAIAKDVVAAYGGTLEKFIGDAVMGVFGLPQAHGDDAERALSASLELRDRVRSDPALADLKLRFGLCTGDVVAAREPSADFLVTGDAVNVAARLQQAAEPWAILAAERTLAATAASFDVGQKLTVEGKGKTSQIVAHEVRSRLGAPRARRTSRAQMRGRQDELDGLALIGRRAFKDRRPAFVTIIAPAGAGKTRLLEEFLQREQPIIAPDALVTTAQCLPYGNQLTYWPLRQVLFKLVGIPEEAAAGEIRRRLASWVGDPRHAEMLAASIGYGVGEAPDRSDVFAAWRLALEKASAGQPVVIVFEDLHWSSDSLLDLVDFVMQAHGDAPILMLALSRPELIDRRPNWGGGRRNFSNLFLEPLNDADMRSLVRDLVEGAAQKTVEAVVSRSGGNPFYAEEMVRSIVQGGDTESLPDTVQASIQAWLDLLPAEEKRVLQLGSIFGRTFRITGVLALSSDLESHIATLIEDLLRHDVTRRDDDDHMSFRHILIREVAYLTLTRAERARLHAAAGGWLESRSEGREGAVAELVAFHYREAVSLLGRTRLAAFDEQGLRAKAMHWLSRAGEAAAAAGAHLEASRHFRAAIEIGSGEELPDLYERLGDVEQLRFGSIDAYLKALELGRKAGRPPVDELRVLGGLLNCVMRWPEGMQRFSMSEVDRMLSEGRALVPRVDDSRSLARFFAAESFYPWHVRRQGGEPTAEMITVAESRGQEASSLAESIGDWNTWSAAIDGVASCLMTSQGWAAVRDLSELRVARRNMLSVLERMDAYHVVSWMSFLTGDLAYMERSSGESMGLVDFAQNPSMILALLGERMHVLLLIGRWDEAVVLGDRVMRIWNETHEALGPGRIGFLAGLDIARARRDATRATQFQEALLEMAPRLPAGPELTAYVENDFTVMEKGVLRTLEVRFGRIDVVERLLSRLNDHGFSLGESTLAQAERLVDELQVPVVTAQLLRARRDYGSAAHLFSDLGASPYEARARIELRLSQGVRPDADAVGFLRGLGDIEYLEAHQLRE